MIAQPTTSSTSTTATRATRTSLSRLEVAGILLMMAGDGYINGNFIQPINVGWGAFIDIIHLVPLLILLWLGVELLRLTDESSAATTRRRGLRLGVSLLAALIALTCVVMVALGVFAPSLGVGVQEFSDWLAVILGGGGALLWFITLFQGRRGA
ncbi:MAG TPA: hypothetical protein VFN78_04870 [Ktedonobacterales bacterium]|nr:hypothetical protein [Ktedonobacterales bacterium]